MQKDSGFLRGTTLWADACRGPVRAGSQSRRGVRLIPLVLAVAAAAVLVSTAAAQAGGGSEARASRGFNDEAPAPPGGWLVEWTPYFWGSGLIGDVGIRDRSVSIDLSFRELIKHVDGALFLPVLMRKGRWSTGIELMLVRLSDQRGTPGPLFESVEVSADQQMVELSLGYQPIAGPKPLAVDLLAGARIWQLGDRLSFTTSDGRTLLLEAGDNWVDPIIGTRVVLSPGGRWSIAGRGDIGGFGVGSEFTWQLIGALGYLVGDRVTLRAGYRYLDVDFRDEGTGFLFDVATRGWIAGVSIRP